MLRTTEKNVESLVAESKSHSRSVPVRTVPEPALSKPLGTFRHQAFSAPYSHGPLAPPAPPPTTTFQSTGLSGPAVLAVDHRRNQPQDLSIYTSRLIQYGIDDNVEVRYDAARVDNASPSLFSCRVYVGNFTAEGSGTTKKEAKHKASEAAFLSIFNST